jgi:integrase
MGLKAARKAAAAALAAVREGRDPTLERRLQRKAAVDASGHTFEHVRAEYLAYCERRQKPITYAENRRVLHSEDFTAWLGIPVAQLTDHDAQAVIDSVYGRDARTAANRTRSLLLALFDFCKRRRYVAENPIEVIERPHRETPRERFLSDSELKLFWQGLKVAPISEPIKRMLRLLLITGQRTSDVRLMEVHELDLENKLWLIPGRKTKTGAPQAVPLSFLALWQLEQDQFYHTPPLPKRGYVFRSPGTEKPYSAKVLSKAVSRWTAYATEKGKPILAPGAEPWTPHDLRRTVRTNLARLRFDSSICELVLGHAIGGMRGVYDVHSYLDEKREALDAWAQRLWGIVAEVEDIL